LQLVVTVGLPAVVMLKTSQCLEVVVVGWHFSPDTQVTVGQTGPVSYGVVMAYEVVEALVQVLRSGSTIPVCCQNVFNGTTLKATRLT